MSPGVITYRCGQWTVTLDRFDLGRTFGRSFFERDGVPWINAVDPHTGRGCAYRAAEWLVGVRPVQVLDGNPFNLCRANLRYVDDGPSPAPQKRTYRGKPGFRGVCRSESLTKPWRAQFYGKHLGMFSTAEEAARAFDRHVLAIRGPTAKLNFPQEATAS